MCADDEGPSYTVDTYGPLYRATRDQIARGEMEQVRPAMRRDAAGEWREFHAHGDALDYLGDDGPFVPPMQMLPLTARYSVKVGEGVSHDEAFEAARRYIMARYGDVSSSWRAWRGRLIYDPAARPQHYDHHGPGSYGAIYADTRARIEADDREDLASPAANMTAALRIARQHGLFTTSGRAAEPLTEDSLIRGMDAIARPHVLGRVVAREGDQIRINLGTHRLDEGNTPMATPPARTPYDRHNVGAAMMADASSFAPEDSARYREAEGFSTSDLDTLARERWVQGNRKGEAKGRDEAEARYPDVYREGWAAGSASVPQRLAEQLGHRAHLVHNLAGALSRVPNVPAAVLLDACAAIDGVMGDLIAEFNDPDRPAREADHRNVLTYQQAATREEVAGNRDLGKLFAMLAELRRFVPAVDDEEVAEREPLAEQAARARTVREAL